MSKINQTYRHDQPECSIWVGVSQEQKPSYETGRYWYRLQHSTVFIRQFEKPKNYKKKVESGNSKGLWKMFKTLISSYDCFWLNSNGVGYAILEVKG